ncbi:hypothetical protein GGX14DRAFT_420327 [Mycena pura]|uniref:DUF6697 domain-containing protein n=1 Tax=Mycena pura TaxID=153505 RepID=A0AAD6YP31_9AGAR|nr:hypothetical protein GGX14DRAFT_420327 [Mycena pura]
MTTSEDYAMRADMMRQWSLDCERIVLLQDQVTAIQVKLEESHQENAVLKSQIEALRRDAETHRNRFVDLEVQLSERDEAIKQLRSRNNAPEEPEDAKPSLPLRPTSESLQAAPVQIKAPPVCDHRGSKSVASTSRVASATAKPEIKGEEETVSTTAGGPQTYVTLPPEPRLQELKAFPQFVPPVDQGAIFSRMFLSANLGGSIQPLIVGIANSQKPLAVKCGIKKFLCPNLKMNPWCPLQPGQHGFMFVGLGNESETFREPEELNLFLSVPPPSGNLEVSYLGLYEAVRVEALTPAEWGTLSSTVQRSYVDVTVSRYANVATSNRPRLALKVQEDYDSGRLSVPCVRLVCKGFDEGLNAGLLEAQSRERTWLNSGPDRRKRPRLDS